VEGDEGGKQPAKFENYRGSKHIIFQTFWLEPQNKAGNANVRPACIQDRSQIQSS
jgi:hypothetical protein